MLRTSNLLVILLLVSFSMPSAGQESGMLPESLPDIPYSRFVLDNGLTVLVHEDHKAPIVAVNVWYHVGSKNEPDGRSGFAHLFEHLMFNGSENYNDDYFQALERVGATDLNGTTNEDRTNYFQNVPVNAVDLALFMESDRMGHLLGAIDQERLEEQRGVVQNEKRQGENQPYGQVENLIIDATYPKGHPYDHSVIGSMEDLNAASLDDVKTWFKDYYGPNNAVVVIAGDIDTATARQKAEEYFGDIQPGPPVQSFDTWIAKREGEQRQTMQDRVPQARIYMVWNVPPAFTDEIAYLDMAGDVLTDGKSSRLYNRLVYSDQIATDVNAFIDERQISSQFRIQATARPGQDLSEVEHAIREELGRFLEAGPTETEVERIKVQNKARVIRGIERIGGFGGKSDILARSEVYGTSPEAWKQELVTILAATPEDIRRTAADWLSDGAYILEVHPFPELTAADSGVDRSALPNVTSPPAASFPVLERSTLSNGLKIVLAERDASPLVNISLLLDAGAATDQQAIPGLARLAMTMLDEGTETRTAVEISDELDMLGATLGSGSNLDISVVSLSSLKENLGASLNLYADVVLNPSFPEGDLERLRNQLLATIQREQVTPIQMALRVFPKLLYGDDHAYGLPYSGSGSAESVASITRQDLIGFHDTWFKPNNATLVAVGDITMDELVSAVEAKFGSWRRGSVPSKNIGTVPHKDAVVYLMDRPGSQQSIIFAGHVAPPRNNPDEVALVTANNIVGGTFTARVNMNLREEKGWSYGAFSILLDARGQRPFIVYAPVQTDKTAESIAEAQRELREYIGENPATEAELQRALANQTMQLAGQWETIGSVLGSVQQIVQYELPDDYWNNYSESVLSLNEDRVRSAAKELVRPENLVWIVVGDKSVIEPGIRDLGIGEIYTIDGDGNIIGTN
ncbi:MAG: insulinase family protein [Rhodothermales bacterium]|nr:insulinase family protein [Rhodothermales bacterium]